MDFLGVVRLRDGNQFDFLYVPSELSGGLFYFGPNFLEPFKSSTHSRCVFLPLYVIFRPCGFLDSQLHAPAYAHALKSAVQKVRV